MGTQIYSMLAAIVVLLVLGIADKVRGVTNRLEPRARRLRQLSNVAIAFLVLCLGLWFSLPSTPSLRTFGMPDRPEDVATPKDVLKYLQRYDEAIASLSDTLHWLLFAGIFWIGWNVVTMMRMDRLPAQEKGTSSVDQAAA